MMQEFTSVAGMTKQFLCWLLFALPTSGSAYEVDTHADLSIESYKSLIISKNKEVRLGLGLIYSRIQSELARVARKEHSVFRGLLIPLTEATRNALRFFRATK
jgi:hypothetical protein